MGSPAYLSREEKEYLKQISGPRYQTQTRTVEDPLTLECTLDAHEAEMILIRKIKQEAENR